MSNSIPPISKLITISGPSGSGKDTLITKLIADYPQFERVVTTTTRSLRPKEKEGVDYYFVSVSEFEQMIADGALLEYSTNENGAYYGVQKATVAKQMAANKVLIWRLDWKGVISIKKLFPLSYALCITASPTNLLERLKGRDPGKPENYYTERLAYAQEYAKHSEIFDLILLNENGRLGDTYHKTKQALLRYVQT